MLEVVELEIGNLVKILIDRIIRQMPQQGLVVIIRKYILKGIVWIRLQYYFGVAQAIGNKRQWTARQCATRRGATGRCTIGQCTSRCPCALSHRSLPPACSRDP